MVAEKVEKPFKLYFGESDMTTPEFICRAAYEAAAVSPLTSPHARFDVTDWLPLEP